MTKDKLVTVTDDTETLEGLKRGDDRYFNLLYKEYYRSIQHFIITNNGSEEDARDVFQEAVIILYNKAQEADFVLSSKLQTYLFAIGKRMWLKRLSRTVSKREEVDGLENTLIADNDLERHHELELNFGKMQAALDELGEPCRTIVSDFYLNNLSMQQITEKFGYTSADNAKTQKYKCLQRLKKLFNKN